MHRIDSGVYSEKLYNWQVAVRRPLGKSRNKWIDGVGNIEAVRRWKT